MINKHALDKLQGKARADITEIADMKQYRKKTATFQYSKKHIEESLYQRRPLSFFEDESSDAEEALDTFDASIRNSLFDYAQDADDAELVKRHLRSFVLKRFSRR